MTQQIILVLAGGLAIGFLFGIASMLLFRDHLYTERVWRMCMGRLAEPPPDLRAISPASYYHFINEQCKGAFSFSQIQSASPHNGAAAAMLTAQDGDHKGNSWFLRYAADTSIGRFDDCDIALEDRDVSRLHAQIIHRINIVTTDEFAIFDYSSTNNTRINGQPINGVASLQDGDQVQIGQTAFVFRRVKKVEQ